MNRLANETSPYLQQHKDNPVEWYPWGDEAFERARAEDKPILLSVGYAACHWCHVMAHESFEDPAVAAVMNRLFVNVKVDREERPDVDAVYMEAVQAMTGRGGWPMTVWLTPDGRPFHGGTYFPKTPKMGMPGFVQLCEAVAQAWTERRDEIVSQAGKVADLLQRGGELTPSSDGLPGREVIGQAVINISNEFDPAWGGFGRAPKFPQVDLLELVLRAGSRAPQEAVTTTLDAMASGGIYDHVGGGFHRYSVDREWLVPHFEKMLYDQAQLARVYLHAWQVTGEARYRQVVTETVDYVRGALRDPGGGFYSSEDADSEGVEGRFYVWSYDEVASVAGADAGAALAWWGVTRKGNFEGANILHRPVRGDLLRPPEIERVRRALFEAREKRVRPGLDDKVLTEWNGLFLAALAEAAAALDRPDWLDDARANAEFLRRALRRGDGRWLRSWQGGRPGPHLAYAADYAAIAGAFVRLAEATGEARWITEARSVADGMLDLFWDEEAGGLFTTGRDGERLITRSKDVLDNVTPSANGSAAVALARLAALTGEERYRQAAEGILALVGEPLRRVPTAFAHLLGALDILTAPATEIAVVGDRPDLVRAVQTRYLPTAVLAWGEPYESPLFVDRRRGFAYVCRDYSCQIPADSVEDLEQQLAATSGPGG